VELPAVVDKLSDEVLTLHPDVVGLVERILVRADGRPVLWIGDLLAAIATGTGVLPRDNLTCTIYRSDDEPATTNATRDLPKGILETTSPREIDMVGHGEHMIETLSGVPIKDSLHDGLRIDRLPALYRARRLLYAPVKLFDVDLLRLTLRSLIYLLVTSATHIL
jgi:hypothetical protein